MSDFKFGFLDLLFLPVALPARGFVVMLQEIKEMAERELYDEQTLRQKLMDLALLYEMGEVEESAYREAWEDITGRLREIEESREE